MRTLIAAAALAMPLTACAVATADAPSEPSPASPTVKVSLLNGGHGSGVHIGGGYFITAGHVAEGSANVFLLSSAGTEAEAEVLWANWRQGGFDVSLVYSAALADEVSAASLSCAKPYVGQYIRAEGNPIVGEFITTWGRVAGTGRSGFEGIAGKAWRTAVTVNVAGGRGSSGGPVYDDKTNELVGIIVAGYGDVSPIAIMVPGNTLCHMLGRTAEPVVVANAGGL